MRTPLLLVLLCAFSTYGQDIPLFSQKLTNSFMYNPSLAGHGMGSLTFSYRNNYSGVEGAPKNNFLSVHAPFADNRFGVGVNFFQEEVTALKNTYVSGAFAYHINFNRFSILSFGVSGEFNATRLNFNLEPGDDQDPVLMQYSQGLKTPDFSFGVNYQHRLIKVGLAANRLYSGWIANEESINLTDFYSGYAQGMIPVSGLKSMIEPYVAFRKFSETSDVLDLGLFYTYDNRIIAGAATRSGNIINGTVGYKINKRILVGYSREMIMGNVGGFTGSSNEFVLRVDFREEIMQKKFRANYKSAVTHPRKSLATSTKNRSAGRNPTQAHKVQKKMSSYSPNARFQNVQKLSQGKKKSYKKKSPAKARKKVVGGSAKKFGGMKRKRR